jgi:hypothetical protein
LKQWNKCYAIYMLNANLPQEMLKKEFFVWFVTSSPHAAPMKLMWVMKDSLWYVVLWTCSVPFVSVISHTFVLLIRSSRCQIRSDPIHRSIPHLSR